MVGHDAADSEPEGEGMSPKSTLPEIFHGLEHDKAVLESTVCLVSPLYWSVAQAGGPPAIKNGSAFFVKIGEGVFGVTASHVIEKLKNDVSYEPVIECLLTGDGSAVKFHPDRVIDWDKEIDIATFRITLAEIKLLRRVVLEIPSENWPPVPPMEGQEVHYCGFPGLGREKFLDNNMKFGAVVGAGFVHGENDLDISIQIERENLRPVLGSGVPPENFDFGGMSGGPIICWNNNENISVRTLAGVIHQGPNPSGNPEESIRGLEIIKARKASFILPCGRLDKTSWERLHWP